MPSPYMEAGTSGNQKLISVAKTAKSYYITKKGINQRVMEIKSTLLPTSVTYSGESLSDTKIPLLFENPVLKDENLSDKSRIRFLFIG